MAWTAARATRGASSVRSISSAPGPACSRPSPRDALFDDGFEAVRGRFSSFQQAVAAPAGVQHFPERVLGFRARESFAEGMPELAAMLASATAC